MLIDRLRQVMMEMKIAMFGAGIGSVKELFQTDRLVFHAWQ
jgi:isopentenyl-diphosphate Delta-isomerase